jgi:hypothetical protein
VETNKLLALSDEVIGNNGIGVYKMSGGEKMGGQSETFKRFWRIMNLKSTVATNSHQGVIGGTSGEDKVTLDFSSPVLELTNAQVDEYCDGGHAEWYQGKKPVLSGDGKRATGKVHYGASWRNEISYSAWATGVSLFGNPL